MAKINLTDDQFDAILDLYADSYRMEIGSEATELIEHARGQQQAIVAMYAIVTEMDVSTASVNLHMTFIQEYLGKDKRLREQPNG